MTDRPAPDVAEDAGRAVDPAAPHPDDGAAPAEGRAGARDDALAEDRRIARDDALAEDAPVAEDAGPDDQGATGGVTVGTSRLREVVAMARRVGPQPKALRDDAIAGMVGAISSVPDGMASAVLAGANPIAGLYACAVGPIVGGLLVAAPLMVVTTTSAGALSAGAAVAGVAGPTKAESLFLLVLLAGLLQVLAGVLRLGRLTHFVSHSVMVGFLTGVAVLIVLGQFGDITGTSPQGSGNVAKAIDVVLHPGDVQLVSLAIGLIAIAITVAPIGGFLGKVSPLIAVAVPAILVIALGLDQVRTVADVGEIPQGLPIPVLPRLDLLSADLVTGAFAVGAIILVQGAGVAESFPPGGGRPTAPSRDFVAQGAANTAVGLFRGIPVGASVSGTALSVSSGAQTRWAAILAGGFMLLILVVFSPVVELVPMPALAGLLIVAGLTTIKVDEFLVIWRTGLLSRIAIVATFIATLSFPIQAAVGIGILMSTILNLYQASMDVSISELVELPGGGVEERKPPKSLPSEATTTLDIHGSMFYAGARTFARLLPSPEGSTRPVVVLRLRGRTKVGATFIEVVDRYAGRLAVAGGRLYLSGVDDHVRQQLVRSGKLDLGGAVRLDPKTAVIGESTRRAIADANAWLVEAPTPAPHQATAGSVAATASTGAPGPV
ncbi:MAG TPA: SulP family inorganic anion transporter [Candidatus Limnocylindrales bacterium]